MTMQVGKFLRLIAASGLAVTAASAVANMAQAAPLDRRGEALGYQQSVAAFGRVAGPVIAGLLFDHVAVDAPFFAAAVMAALALSAVWTLTAGARAGISGRPPAV